MSLEVSLLISRLFVFRVVLVVFDVRAYTREREIENDARVVIFIYHLETQRHALFSGFSSIHTLHVSSSARSRYHGRDARSLALIPSSFLSTCLPLPTPSSSSSSSSFRSCPFLLSVNKTPLDCFLHCKMITSPARNPDLRFAFTQRQTICGG